MRNILKNNKLIPIIYLAIFLIIQGCKDSGVDVIPVKDPRTYTWTADTLAYPRSSQTLMDDIWGSSHNDVYVVGHNSRAGKGVMWHYDGNKWTNSHLLTSEGGLISGAIELSAIYGFSGTDIYAAGERIIGYNPNPPPNFIDSSLILHYDGSSWKEEDIVSGNILTNIQGSSTNNVWAAGNFNTLYHYDGSRWTRDSVVINVPVNQAFHILSVGAGNSGTYLTGHTSFVDLSDTKAYLLKRENSSWVKIDSSGIYTYKLYRNSSGELYYAGPRGIFKNVGNQWTNVFTTNQYIADMSASSSDNIFAAGQGGQNKIYHYNGTDWKEIEELSLPDADYWAVWTDGTEAFVVGHIYDAPYQKTVIWHGK